MTDIELSIKNLKKSFKNFTLSIKDLQLKSGDIFVLIGPNGAGKTTTMNCILGLYRIDEGKIEIKVNGENVKLSDYNFLHQNENPMEYLKAREYLSFISEFYNIPDKDKVISILIKRFNIDDNKLVKEFSFGMKKKLLMTKAMINRPKFLFIDEPFESIEVETRKEIRDILKEEASKGTIVFFTSHNLFEAEKFANKFGFIKEGKFLGGEKISDLKDSLEDYYLKRMIE